MVQVSRAFQVSETITAVEHITCIEWNVEEILIIERAHGEICREKPTTSVVLISTSTVPPTRCMTSVESSLLGQRASINSIHS